MVPISANITVLCIFNGGYQFTALKVKFRTLTVFCEHYSTALKTNKNDIIPGATFVSRELKF